MSEPKSKYKSLELSDNKDLYKQSDKIEILDSTINTINSTSTNLSTNLNKISEFHNSDLEANSTNEKLDLDLENPYNLDLLNTKLYNRDYHKKNQFFIGLCFALLYRRGDPLITIGPHCKNKNNLIF